MTTFSKFYQEYVENLTCQEFGLHSTSCKEHLIHSIWLYILSNFKYFAPVCLLPLLVNIQNVNRERLRKTLEYYLGCAVTGSVIGLTINCLICLFRNIHGKFGYNSALFIPSMLGSCITYLSSAKVINLYETSIFQCAVENFLIMRKNFISRAIANSQLIQTYLFMICSGIILHTKRVYNAKGFWLFTANPQIHSKENNEEFQTCELHPNIKCKKYLIEGMRKYFILGLSLDLIKMLMQNVDLKQNQSKLMGKLKSFRIRSTALLTAYIGIYRFTHCWLNRKSPLTNNHNHILSAILAGSCYYLYPQSTLFSFAVIQAIRSLWTIFETSNTNNKNKAIKFMLQIPYSKLMFPLALGQLVHLMVMQPLYVSNLSSTISNGIANSYAKHIGNKLTQLKIKYNIPTHK